MVEADSHLKWCPYPYKTCAKCLSTLMCCPLAYSNSLKQLYPSYLAQIWGFWVTCGVKMMSLRQGWGWQPPQTASHIQLDIYKVFEHIDMLSISIHHQPNSVLLTLLGSDCGVLGHLWGQNDVITPRLRLTATSNCLPHPYKTYTKCLSTLICCPSAYNSSLTQFYSP